MAWLPRACNFPFLRLIKCVVPGLGAWRLPSQGSAPENVRARAAVTPEVKSAAVDASMFPVSTPETNSGTFRTEDFWFIVAARSQDETEIRAG